MWWKKRTTSLPARDLAMEAFARSLEQMARSTAERDRLMHQMVRDTLDTWRKVIQGLMLQGVAEKDRQVAALFASGAAIDPPRDPIFREPPMPPEPEDDPIPDLLPLGELPRAHSDGGDPPTLGDPLT